MRNPILVLTCDAPLQSWGVKGRFNNRDTHKRPTMSGILGIVSAAAGKKRGEEPLLKAEHCQFTVRDDRPGSLLQDYHTIGGGHKKYFPGRVHRNTEGKKVDNAVLTERWYLQDAAFTVFIETEASDVDRAAHALEHPAWQLSLGRRSCPPSAPILTGVSTCSVEELCQTLPVLINRQKSETINLETSSSTFSEQRHSLADIPEKRTGRRTFSDRTEGVRRVSVASQICIGTGPKAWASRRNFLEE